MKTVLIISYSPLHSDPRINRQIKALKGNYNLITIGFTKIPDDTIKHYSINIPTKKTIYEIFYLLFYFIFAKNIYINKILSRDLDLNNILSKNIDKPDIIIANDWNGLYLATLLKNKLHFQSKIYFDAHEYSPKEFNNSFKWRLFYQPVILYSLTLCRSDISIMSTVCDGIASEYERFFNFKKGTIKIITNASDFNDTLKPKNINQNEVIRLIHHGGAIKERKLELMIKMMKHLNSKKYELTLMLVETDQKYYNYLLKKSNKFINIKFIKPVQFYEIINKLNSYDIGVFLLPPNNFNYKYALPNKLFEFIQARLAIAIGPSPEMKKIVNKYNLGICSDKFTPKSLAKKIKNISISQINEYKINTNNYAKLLSADENINLIKEIIFTLTN